MRSDLDDAFVRKLRAELADETAGVVADPLTTQRALAGGRRRLARRRGRATIAVTAGAVLAVSAASFGPATVTHVSRFLDRTGLTNTNRGDRDVYGALNTRRPAGDLIGDVAYTTSVLRAWQDSHHTSANRDRGIFDDLRGPARVVWAGSTPGGPAAVVVQQAYLHRHPDLSDDDTDHVRTLIGFIGVDARGRPRVVGDDYGAAGGGPIGGWFVDPAGTVLASVDLGAPVGYGSTWTYGADGTRTMQFTPVKDDASGVAAVRLATGVRWQDVRMSQLPCRGPDSRIGIAGNGLAPAGIGDRPSWQGSWPIGGITPVPGTDTATALGDFVRELDAQTIGVWDSELGGAWSLAGQLPDGRRIVVASFALDGQPAQVYVRVSGEATPRIVHGGPFDPAATLPVSVRLPDGTGWIVGRPGAVLRWRTGTGPWHSAGKDAALLPDSATQVEVSRDGIPKVVDLRAG